MNRISFSTLGACLALAWGLLASQPAAAQQSMEELVVTATKRGETVAEVPFSVAAMSEEELQRLGIGNIEELAHNVAGLSIQNLGPGQSQVAMRGLSAGQIIRDQPGVKEQVGIYLDESAVSLSLFTPDFDLYDLDRVEVLRGPQGTLFGAGSVGGTIRYITSQPELGANYGSIELDFNSVAEGQEGGHVKGMVNIPIGSDTALRLVGYSTDFAGFIDALGVGDTGEMTETDDVNSGNRQGMRVALKWQPADYFTVTPRLVFQKTTLDGFNRQEIYHTFANPYLTDPIEFDHRQQYLLVDGGEGFEDETLLFDLNFVVNFDTFDLTSVTSILDREIWVSRDASALSGSVSIDLFQRYVEGKPPGADADPPMSMPVLVLPEADYALASNLIDTTDLRQFTQELRLSSSTDSQIQWLAGIYISEVDRQYAQRLPTPGYDDFVDRAIMQDLGTDRDGPDEDMDPDVRSFPPADRPDVLNGFAVTDSPYNSDVPYDISQLAAFAEITRHFDDRLSATLGYRWYTFEEERTFTSGGFFAGGDTLAFKTDSTGISPRLIVSFKVNDQVTWNAQAAKGFRFGGSNDPLNVPLCHPTDVENFGHFLNYDDETSWNYETGFKAAFNNGIDLNVSFYRTDIRDLQVTTDAGTCSSRIVINVPEAHSTGLEFELTAEPREGLLLSLAGSMLESEFDSTILGPDVDDDGNVIEGQFRVLDGIEDGNRLPSVPKFQIAGSLTYTWPIQWFGGADAFLSGSIQHVSDRITQPKDQNLSGLYRSGLPYGGATGMEATAVDLDLESYTIANLRFGIMTQSWETAFYMNNATDENALLSFDRERDGRARLAFRTNQPRTVGLLFRKRFQQ